MKQTMNQKGALTVVAIVWITPLCLGALALLGLTHRWHEVVRLQFRLDHCIGSAALEFKNTMETLEQMNQRIIALRASILAAQLQPELIAPLKAALSLCARHQDTQRIAWNAFQSYNLKQCRAPKDQNLPLPPLLYERPPADSLGERPLSWRGEMPSSWKFALWQRPREAAALVRRPHENRNIPWTAIWTGPH